jgi:hypothetical protein
LSGNQLSGSIPSELLKRAQDKSLQLRYLHLLSPPLIAIQDQHYTSKFDWKHHFIIFLLDMKIIQAFASMELARLQKGIPN